ncbi:MAG TPA: hypothetical protein VG964_00725 [Candidatus Saccharimonadales bacterium]|nr:hypothetical protein [Candidatus Saccharimonadales bacterium]
MASLRRFEREKTEPPLPVKYELGYSWGMLHVTPSADRAYGLVPLTTPDLSEVEERDDDGSTVAFPTHVWVVGPDELQERSVALNATHTNGHGVTIRAGANVVSDEKTNNINIYCGFPITDKEIEKALTDFAEDAGIEVDDDGNPDYMIEQAHMLLAHAISPILNVKLATDCPDILHSTSNAIAMEEAKITLASGMAGTLMVAMALDASGLDSELMAAAPTAIGATFALRRIRKHFAQAAELRKEIAERSALHAFRVSEDFHTTFCPYHFDEQLQQRLGNLEP